MKNHFFNGLLILISFAFMSSSCSSDDDGPSNNMAEIQEIINNTQTGTWRITSYVDSGQNETSDYNGYDFTFNSDGTVTASNGTTIENGTWSVTNSSNSSDIDFNLNFPVPDTHDFDDLNDDWDIINHNNNILELIDISGGNGGTDTLTFMSN